MYFIFSVQFLFKCVKLVTMSIRPIVHRVICIQISSWTVSPVDFDHKSLTCWYQKFSTIDYSIQRFMTDGPISLCMRYKSGWASRFCSTNHCRFKSSKKVVTTASDFQDDKISIKTQIEFNVILIYTEPLIISNWFYKKYFNIE